MGAFKDGGATAISTSSDAEVTVISAADTVDKNFVDIQNNGSTSGLVSVDGGANWFGFGIGSKQIYTGRNKILGVIMKNDVAGANLSAIRVCTQNVGTII